MVSRYRIVRDAYAGYAVEYKPDNGDWHEIGLRGTNTHFTKWECKISIWKHRRGMLKYQRAGEVVWEKKDE